MRIYKNDTGTVLTIDAGINISTGTSFSIRVQKPDNSIVTWPGTLSAPNYVTYTSVVDTFDLTGEYICNLKVTSSVGSWTGETFTLTVYDNGG
jgi:hypothetical protein